MENMEFIEIPLCGPSGEGKFTLVDGDYDGELFSCFKWYVHYKTGYVYTSYDLHGNRRTTYLHDMVIGKKPKGLWIDHKNRNKLDNRSCNLRLVTPKENAANRPVQVYNPDWARKRSLNRKKPKGKFVGVKKRSGPPRTKMYTATYKGKYIGHYLTPEEAGMAYDDAIAKDLGDEYRINFPMNT